MSKKETKRLFILEQAVKCLEERGYYGTNLEDVGQRVGLNKSSLLYYFNSKDEMLMQATFYRLKPIVEEIQSQTLLQANLLESLSFYYNKRLKLYLKITEDVKLDLIDLIEFEVQFKTMFSDFYTHEEIFIGHLIRSRGNLKKIYKGNEMELGQYVAFIYRSIRKNYFVFKLENKKMSQPKFDEMIGKLTYFLKLTVLQIEL